MRPLDECEREFLIPRRLRLSEYHLLIHCGVLDEDEHVELLDGLLSQSQRPGPAEARVRTALGSLLTRSLGSAYRVRPGLPLSLGDDSEPEPDLAIVTRQEEETAPVHPRAALLVVEVADESLRRDRLLKGRIYARARVPEYWVVDVTGRSVEVYSEPDADSGRYRVMRSLGVGESLSTTALPGLTLPVSKLFA